MKKDIHFISSLPRSGSTLLCNILLQNSRFHATQTSGMLDVLFGIRNSWHNLIEHKAHPVPHKLSSVLAATMEAYYEEIEQPVIFDKSRGHLSQLDLLEEILGQRAKVLVCIRPVVDILASFEMLYRETSKVKQPPGEAENYFQFQTVKGRCAYWMQQNQVVGLALNRLEDAMTRGFRDRLFFVDFNSLTSYPHKTMQKIYNFLEEDQFEHNFDHVEQLTQEDDEVHGYVNLHKIQNKVVSVKSRAKEILGEEVYKFYSKNN